MGFTIEDLIGEDKKEKGLDQKSPCDRNKPLKITGANFLKSYNNQIIRKRNLKLFRKTEFKNFRFQQSSNSSQTNPAYSLIHKNLFVNNSNNFQDNFSNSVERLSSESDGISGSPLPQQNCPHKLNGFEKPTIPVIPSPSFKSMSENIQQFLRAKSLIESNVGQKNPESFSNSTCYPNLNNNLQKGDVSRIPNDSKLQGLESQSWQRRIDFQNRLNDFIPFFANQEAERISYGENFEQGMKELNSLGSVSFFRKFCLLVLQLSSAINFPALITNLINRINST